MSGEPTRPKSTGDLSSTQKSGPGGALPKQRPSAAEDIAAFVAKARAMSPHAAGARGRLVFALDATMSRQPTWDMACALQADMFREAAAVGKPIGIVGPNPEMVARFIEYGYTFAAVSSDIAMMTGRAGDWLGVLRGKAVPAAPAAPY